MTDIEIRQFREDLISLINSTVLPLEVKRLVLIEVSKAVTDAADNFIKSQKEKVIEQLANQSEQEVVEDAESRED